MTSVESSRVDIMKLFENKKLVKICAPMVRYSKLQFRTLVREYGCDLCFTPMILADSFCKSEKARRNEFTTSLNDTPLITQFAANTVHDFVGAANMVSPYCDGVDLNCGCPQRWAKQLGLGCSMLETPELIADLVKQCKNQINKTFPVSVKTRILKDERKTIEICRQLEHAGASFLTIHARTPSESTGDISVEMLKLIVQSVQCPVIANGGVKSLENCHNLQQSTNCKGVMVANSILTNPTLFSNSDKTTLDCLQKWIDTCYNSTLTLEEYQFISKEVDLRNTYIPERPSNLTFQCFHHHLVFMLEKILPKRKRRVFNNFQTFKQVLMFLEAEFNLQPNLFSEEKFMETCIVDPDYKDRDAVYNDLNDATRLVKNITTYDPDASEGSFFINKVNRHSSTSLEDSFTQMFLEID